MRLILVLSLLLATVVFVLQLADILWADTPWNLQWVPYDAAPYSVYTLFMLAMMILWWPTKDSWKFGYTNQVNQEETEAGGETHKVKAEQVGVNEEKL